MGLGKYIQFKLIYKPNLNKRSNFFPFIMVRPKTLTLSCPLLLTTLSLDRFLFSTFLFQLNSLLHYRQWQIHRQECKARHWSKYYRLSFLLVTPLPLKLNFIYNIMWRKFVFNNFLFTFTLLAFKNRHWHFDTWSLLQLFSRAKQQSGPHIN